MKIQNSYQYSIPVKTNNARHVTANKSSYPKDSMTFCGHTGLEIFNNSFGRLIHETLFFRDLRTKTYVKEYIEKHFAKNPKINILVGGCSTGEEAITYSMMLNNLKDKVKILGFDLSPTSIKEANSKKYIMQYIKKIEVAEKYSIASNKDAYLWVDTGKPLTAQQKRNKKLFDEFFEPLNEKPPKSLSPLRERIYMFFLKIFNGVEIPKFKNKYYGLKAGKAENTNFVVGDINQIEKIAEPEKMDVITFSNSLYHLTTTIRDRKRFPRYDMEKVLDELIPKIKQKLNNKGLFVLGEREYMQMMDSQILPRLMKKHGFEAVDVVKNNMPSVYIKTGA